MSMPQEPFPLSVGVNGTLMHVDSTKKYKSKGCELVGALFKLQAALPQHDARTGVDKKRDVRVLLHVFPDNHTSHNSFPVFAAHWLT